MPTFHPDLNQVKKTHQPPTEGELYILSYLKENLNDSSEVFIQPQINGDNPDIVILRKNYGIIIIEVKDWNLNNYTIKGKTNWELKANNVKIRSPFSQVSEYKDNLIKLHIDRLYEYYLKNKSYSHLIKCVIYFHKTSKAELLEAITGTKNIDAHQAIINSLEKNCTYITCKDSLEQLNIDLLFEKESNTLFEESLYKRFRRYLQPPFHRIEEGIDINYTPQQRELIKSESGQKRKIKGLAGCGKTMVLAKRAVNAHVRTKSNILILTFNLSLTNYIHDKINEVREEFYWKYFYITNYHQFFKSQANNHNLPITSLEPFSNTFFFEPVKNEIAPYEAVFIDEIQDYNTNWIEIITKYFTNKDTELVVFGDEKQNIYNRPLDENREPVIKTIRGSWNKSLNTSKRFTSNIGKIALKFQREFFNKKYSIDEIEVLENPELDFYSQTIEYIFYNNKPEPFDFIKKYISIVEKLDVHPSDIGILSARVDFLRELDKCIRTKMNEKTETTFESAEYFKKLTEENHLDIRNQIIEEIRRNKKIHFWLKTGTTKLATVHSFKGWEIHSLFLIIEDDTQLEFPFTSSEIIYTGLTRAKINLIVINFGNKKYHDFFRNNLKTHFVN
ncbi:MAG: hypothetical protein A2X03_07115 [Bacteroidetes bacterium GWA2_40_15]|nr:MAG: hypothetical protein A2X03_07115 [Bacteroidetes bacterium GWA2_40_15]